jgi:uncharacterized protein
VNKKPGSRSTGTRLMGSIINHPWLVIAVHLLLFSFFLVQAGHVKAGVNVEDFFPERAPSRLLYDRMAEWFPDDSWGTVLIATDKAESSKTLLAVQKFEQALLEEPLVYKVRTVLTVKDIRSKFDTLKPEALIVDPNAKAEVLEKRWRELKADPRFGGSVMSSDGALHAVRIQIDPSRKGDAEARRAFRGVVLKRCGELEKSLKASAEKKEAIFVLATGLPLIRAAYVELIEQDLGLLLPLALLLVGLILVLMFRSFGDICIPMIIVVVSLVWTLGTVAMMDKILNQILQVTPVIILIVGVSDSIHLVNRINDRLAEAKIGDKPKDLIIEACTEMAFACLLTSLTTIVGFLSLATTNIETIVDFGIITSAGIAYAFIITVTLLPAVIGLLGKKAGEKRGVRSFWGPLFIKLEAFVSRSRKLILFITLCITILSIISCNWIDTNSFVFDDLRPKSELKKDIEIADKLYGGILPFTLLLEGPPDSLVEPETVKIMGELREMLTGFELIEVSRALDLTVKRAHYVWNNEDKTMNVVPNDRAMINQYLLLLPRDMANEFLKRDMAVVTARTRDVGSVRLKPMLLEIEEKLKPFRERLKKMKVTLSLTGTTPLVQEVYDSILSSLSSSVLASIIFMTVLFLFMFRSPKAVFIALLPNFLPIIWLIACLVFLGIALKPSTVIIFSTAFGIAVDDTIHFIARFRAERSAGLDRALAIQRTTSQTGAAIVTTSLVLSSGFLVLILSLFEGLSNLGLLLCLGLIIALIADLFFLPALLGLVNVDFGPVPDQKTMPEDVDP